MELYKIGKIKLKRYGKEFKEELIEFLDDNGYIYHVKYNSITVYGARVHDKYYKYPTEEELDSMVNDYLDKLYNPDDDPEHEVDKETFKKMVNDIESGDPSWLKLHMTDVEDPIICPSCCEKYDNYDDLAACCIFSGNNAEDNGEIFICRKCGNKIIIYDDSINFNEDEESE